MDIRKLQRAIVDGLEDVKAQNIRVFNTEHLSPLFERVIVASGTSNRQTKALAASVRDAVRSAGHPVLRTEGEDNGEWIIVDCGAAVVHIMQPAIRDYYHLEEIWGDKPVRLKGSGSVAAGRTGLVKASEPVETEPEPAPRRKPARKSAAAKVPSKNSAKSPAKMSASAISEANPKAPAKPARKAATRPASPREAMPAAKAAPKAASKPATEATAKSPAKAAPRSITKPAAKAAPKATAKAAPKAATSRSPRSSDKG